MNETHRIELVKRVCKGEIEAFHEIVELHKKKVYYIALDICGDHHEAEDISQEVFIKVFKSIHKFRREAKLSTWIYQVSVNTAIDAIRKYKKHKKQVPMETAEIDSLPSAATGSRFHGPEELAARNQLRNRLMHALPCLSKKERTVFAMRYINEFKLPEIAEILDLSINSIKTLLLRARKKLQKKLAAPEVTP